MKCQPTIIAKAAAATTATVYIICATVFVVIPDFAMSIAKSWFHGIDITAFGASEVTISSFFLGFVTAIITGWLIAYLFAWFSNVFAKK